jgi:hypothetical protein
LKARNPNLLNPRVVAAQQPVINTSPNTICAGSDRAGTSVVALTRTSLPR